MFKRHIVVMESAIAPVLHEDFVISLGAVGSALPVAVEVVAVFDFLQI